MAGFGFTDGFGVTAKAKNFFFDRPAVKAMMKNRTDEALGKAGAFVRRSARTLIGKPTQKGKVRPPGKPPKARSTHPTISLRNIQFALDPSKFSVVIGPLRLNAKQYKNGRLMSGTVPAVHEFGGTVGIREKLVGSEWRPYGRRKPRPGQAVRVRMASYPARPFMGPALAQNASKFPTLWGERGGGYGMGATG